MDLIAKHGQLKGYANELRQELEQMYSEAGKVMPRDLQDAPVSLSPRNERHIAEELRKATEQREEIATNGRIEQLEAENDMLKEQLRKGLPDGDSILASAEEKSRLLQEELEEKQARIKELEEEQLANR